MTVRAFRVAYDGRPFHGFQRQPDVPTVEGALLDALAALGVLPEGGDRDPPPGYAAAGRTDAGVSALAQTVAFRAPEWLTPAALNAELPGSVRAWAHADAPSGFHATHDADARTYVYHLHAPAGEVDHDRARRALAGLAGTHDFHNLTPEEPTRQRTLRTALTVQAPFLVLEFTAGGFDRQLVRRAVSLVDAIARGERRMDALERVLGAGRLDGPEGVPPAPPTPLVLTAVTYPGLSFSPDPDALADARSRFRDLAVERRQAARAAATVADGLGEP